MPYAALRHGGEQFWCFLLADLSVGVQTAARALLCPLFCRISQVTSGKETLADGWGRARRRPGQPDGTPCIHFGQTRINSFPTSCYNHNLELKSRQQKTTRESLHSSLKPYTIAAETKKSEGTCFQDKKTRALRHHGVTVATPSTTPKLLHSNTDLNYYGTLNTKHCPLVIKASFSRYSATPSPL